LTLAGILKSLPKREQREAIWLFSSILKKNHSELLLDSDSELEASALKQWKKFSRERKSGKPLQYVVGSAPFWGREFKVGKGVLIPRPETEVLVDLALQLFPPGEVVRALDIGTGSGAIALTLQLERPEWKVAGSDLSAAALKFAKTNAKALGVSVEFSRADLFSPKLQQQSWDLVISNPPYLDFKKDKITDEVKKWEPKSALEPGAASTLRGVKERAAWCAERILLSCAESRPKFTALELSARVAKSLEQRWKKNAAVERIWRAPDLAGKKRFLIVAWREKAALLA
jgi:release factor glutamine methyltransferase